MWSEERFEVFCTYCLHQGQFRVVSVHVAASGSERQIGLHRWRQIYFVCKFSHAKYKPMLRYAKSDSFFTSFMHRYTSTAFWTLVTELSSAIKTKDTCFEIAEAEVAPDNNWLDFKVCFQIKYLSNTRHVKFNFLLYTENTATVRTKLHVHFFPTLKYACHFLCFFVIFIHFFFQCVNCHFRTTRR
jgi:hypothetical protein